MMDADLQSGQTRVLSLADSLHEGVVLSIASQYVIKPSSNVLGSISTNQVKHLVVKLDIQEFLLLLVANSVLVAGLQVILTLDSLKVTNCVQ